MTEATWTQFLILLNKVVDLACPSLVPVVVLLLAVVGWIKARSIEARTVEAARTLAVKVGTEANKVANKMTIANDTMTERDAVKLGKLNETLKAVTEVKDAVRDIKANRGTA